MDYSSFAKAVARIDSRNKVSAINLVPDIVPDELKPFYSECNPVDLEINSNGLVVKFYPADALTELQHEYDYLCARFIFATSNSDPIFWHDSVIYTCPHGTKSPKWERLSLNFDEFITSLITQSHKED
jgi:hypothetical protein